MQVTKLEQEEQCEICREPIPENTHVLYTKSAFNAAAAKTITVKLYTCPLCHKHYDGKTPQKVKDDMQKTKEHRAAHKI